MFKDIRTIIKKSINKSNLEERLDNDFSLIGIVSGIINKPGILVSSVKDGVITVDAESFAVALELKETESQIIEIVNKEIDQTSIKKIRYII